MIHTHRLRHVLRATVTTLGVTAAWTASASATEAPTPQAVDANAEFLAYPSLPAPPVPAKVCVVDTGVDLTTDLGGAAAVERYSVWGGTVDDVGGSGIPKHGTYVAGIIASKLDGQGSVGIWPHARIVSVRVFQDSQSGASVAAYLDGLDVCRYRGASVVNLSLSGLSTTTVDELGELENRIADLQLNWNVSTVTAAGNTGGDVGYPGKLARTLTVGATDRSGRYCAFSARGPDVDISTLGCGVLVSLENNHVGVGAGTSFATPIAAGALAALRSYQPHLSAEQAERILLATARRAGPSMVLDVEAAFRAAGLGGLVHGSTPGSAPAPHSPTMFRTAEHPSQKGLGQLGIRSPRFRRGRYRKGILEMSVSGIPDFGRALFFVDGRRYARSRGHLRVRLRRAPRSLAVAVEVPTVGRSPKVRIRIRAIVAQRRSTG